LHYNYAPNEYNLYKLTTINKIVNNTHILYIVQFTGNLQYTVTQFKQLLLQ